MRVLKPKIDEIRTRNIRKQATLIEEATGGDEPLQPVRGKLPMGGCLPMLLQFPILMALFMFVPSAIELRQQSFFWADDLSTYDPIITFPFHIPFLGNHLSLLLLADHGD